MDSRSFLTVFMYSFVIMNSHGSIGLSNRVMIVLRGDKIRRYFNVSVDNKQGA